MENLQYVWFITVRVGYNKKEVDDKVGNWVWDRQ